MDLLDMINDNKKVAPLAERMRPNSLKDFLGQGHIADKSSLLFILQLNCYLIAIYWWNF